MDMYDILLARNLGGSGGTVDAYTKAQTDALLDRKVDKETGKGLSTNDFTDTDKSNLGIALEKANAAAPQSNTYTKAEVDTALSAKLNTADVDTAISSTSTNPVQNKAVQAPLARLVDAGAKNLLKNSATTHTVNGVTFTINSDGTVNCNGTATADITFSVGNVPNVTGTILSGCPTDGSASTYMMVIPYVGYETGLGMEIPSSAIGRSVQIEIKDGVNTNNLVFRPMICSKSAWGISQKYVPYCPSMAEMYAMIQAMQ